MVWSGYWSGLAIGLVWLLVWLLAWSTRRRKALSWGKMVSGKQRTIAVNDGDNKDCVTVRVEVGVTGEDVTGQ